MVLGRTGYRTVLKSTNGFLCHSGTIMGRRHGSSGILESRTMAWAPAHNPQNRGSHTYLYLMRPNLCWQEERTEVVQATALALDKKELPGLEPGAMCYMMSKQQYLNDPERELVSTSDVFHSGRRGEKLGSQSARLAGSSHR